MRRALVAGLLVVTCAGAGLAETDSAGEFGPYLYRAGADFAYTRFETKLTKTNSGVVIADCAQMIINGIPGQRQCWEHSATAVKDDGKVLIVRNGRDGYIIDRTTSELTLEDKNKPHLKGILPGARPWTETPMSKWVPPRK